MAIHFGDNISDSFLTENAIPQYINYGRGPHRVRTASFHVTVPASTVLTADAILMGRIRSSDRIGGIWLSAPAFTSTAPTINVGLYVSKVNGGYSSGLGTVIDADIFGAAASLNLGTAQNRTDLFVAAGGAAFGVHRWKFAWEIANQTAASYTADPRQTWDLVIAAGNTPTSTGSAFEVLVEVDLIAGS